MLYTELQTTPAQTSNAVTLWQDCWDTPQHRPHRAGVSISLGSNGQHFQRCHYVLAQHVLQQQSEPLLFAATCVLSPQTHALLHQPDALTCLEVKFGVNV